MSIGDLNDIIGPIAKGKTQMEKAASYVKERYKIGSPTYDETERRYNTVQADYNGWLEQLKFYIKQGKKDIKPIVEKFEPITKEINNFVKFVYELAPKIKAAPFALAAPFDLGGIVDAAVKLWDIAKKAREENRKKIIETIDAQSWKNFKDI